LITCVRLRLFPFICTHTLTRPKTEEWETDTTANAPETDLSAARDFASNSTTPRTTHHPSPSQQQTNPKPNTYLPTPAPAGVPLPAKSHLQNLSSISLSRHNAQPTSTPIQLAPSFLLKHLKAERAVSLAASNLWMGTMRRSFFVLPCWMLFCRCLGELITMIDVDGGVA
jgi:hypothetical protein